MTTKFTAVDFRADLTNSDIEAIARHERKQMTIDAAVQEIGWGIRLQAMGIDTSVMRGDGFDPVDYGLERRAKPAPKIV